MLPSLLAALLSEEVYFAAFHKLNNFLRESSTPPRPLSLFYLSMRNKAITITAICTCSLATKVGRSGFLDNGYTQTATKGKIKTKKLCAQKQNYHEDEQPAVVIYISRH